MREPFAIGDVAVRPGDQVLMWLTAANRDLPGPHGQPLDRFDPERDNARQLGFGSGYHLCGGVHHVREVAVAAVTTLAERCPQLRIARAVEALRRHRRRLRRRTRGDRGAVNPPIGLRRRS